MAQLDNSDRTRMVAQFFKRINQGEDPRQLRREAHMLWSSLDPHDVAAAEQNLIDEGYPAQLVQLLSATFMLMTIPQKRCGSVRSYLPPSHFLSRVIIEHDLMRCLVADLTDAVEKVSSLYYLSDVSLEFRTLAHIVNHLAATKGHFAREDDVIFPYLRQHAGISFCAVLQGEHVGIKSEIDNLVCLLASFGRITIEQFQTILTTRARHLTAALPEHISQEDMILYPIALGIVRDDAIWKNMKIFCDEIGYCGLDPQTEFGS